MDTDVSDLSATVNLGALGLWMEGRGLGPGPIENVLELTGGTQNILLRFQKGERTYVIRRPPEHLRPNSNETMRREARVLRALAGTQVPHPRLIDACFDESVLGATFYLMEPVDGFNPSTGLPPLHAHSESVRHRMGLSLVEGISALGALDYCKIGLEDFGRSEHFLERQVDRWRRQLKTYGQYSGWTGAGDLPGVEKVASWLESNRPRTYLPGVIHGDCHLGNVMFRMDGPELAALVDWELATIGDPLLDLGWLLATWPEGEMPGIESATIEPWRGFPTAEELVKHYAERSVRDLSAIHWYGVLASYKLAIIVEGTHARACDGLAPRETGAVLHAKAIALFERALRWIG